MHLAEADDLPGGAGTVPVESIKAEQRIRFTKDWTFLALGVPIAVKKDAEYEMSATLRWNPQPPADSFERVTVIVIH